MVFLKNVHYEIFKIFSKSRTYIGFVTVVILIPIIMLLVRKYGFDVQDQALRSLGNTFVFVGSLVNGLLVSYYLMNVLWIHFPFFIVLVAGDIMAGEGAAGTFRVLLTRPVSRFWIITAKFIATFFYTWAIVFFLGICSLGIGISLVGGGDLFVFDKGILILSQSQAISRFLLAYSLAVIVQMVVASLTFFFSTMTSNGIGPIIGTYAVLVVFYILSVLKISALETIRPYLFTSYFDIFFAPFSDPIPWGEIVHHISLLICYIAGFYLASTIIFIKKDITT
jgi:ABC-2 type transport system permease protein